MPRRPWTADDDLQMRMRYARTRCVDIALELGRSEKSVYQRAKLLGLKKDPAWIAETARARSAQPDHGGIKSRFQKGSVPANKGLRRPGWAPGRMAETQFKPGRPANQARNYRPIGTLRVNADGYL